jgi:hypothetical protein
MRPIPLIGFNVPFQSGVNLQNEIKQKIHKCGSILKFPNQENSITMKEIIRLYDTHDKRKYIYSNGSMRDGFKPSNYKGLVDAEDLYKQIQNQGGQVVYKIDELTDQQPIDNNQEQLKELDRLNRFKQKIEKMNFDKNTKDKLLGNLLGKYQEFSFKYPEIKDPNTGKTIESTAYILNLFRPQESLSADINKPQDGEEVNVNELIKDKKQDFSRVNMNRRSSKEDMQIFEVPINEDEKKLIEFKVYKNNNTGNKNSPYIDIKLPEHITWDVGMNAFKVQYRGSEGKTFKPVSIKDLDAKFNQAIDYLNDVKRK